MGQMEQVFIVLQYRIADKKVTTFINYFDERRIFQYDDYFLLDQARIKRLFLNNVAHLASEVTLSPDFLTEEGAEVVAMTIDGDFILANDHQTFVIPKSFMTADIEVFPQAVIDFFVAYEEQTLVSHTLPTYQPHESLVNEAEDLPDLDISPVTEEPKKGFLARFFK